jgi:isopenicillin N synthase-like dioxygenase
MRGYTPWRVEEVGKLHYDVDIRKMTDSKVCIDDILLKVLSILTDHDTQEHFDQGPTHDTDFPNKWPKAPELRGFQHFMEDFYRQCNDVCLKLMEALEIAWGIDDGSLVARCNPAAADLRLTHYPPMPADELRSAGTSRIAPHTDFGPITLLFQDSTGGLEIEDRANPEPNSFVPIPPTDTTEMIVNVGDTLTRWTNGKITGGVHQVMIPEAMKEEDDLIVPSRMSMAYLFKAGRDVSVGPLPKFVSSTEPAKYPDMTALEYQKSKNSTMYNLDKKKSPNGVNGLIHA